MAALSLRSPWVQWPGLICLTALLLWVLLAVEAPAAALLAPLASGIVFGISGASVRPPAVCRTAAFTIIGCLVAIALGHAMGPALYGRLPAFAAIGAVTLAVCLGLGWLLARRGWFGGATAVWGLAPGNSATMVALAETSGADARLVAVMQYLRILAVTAAAIAVAHVAAVQADVAPPSRPWLPALDPVGLCQTAGLCLAGAVLSKLTRFPPGVFLIPGLGGAGLIAAGLITPQAPPLVALAAYGVVGWNIGLGFTPESLRRSAFALPKIIAATVILLLVCGGAGVAVSLLFHVDLLTGLLATAPGGLDTILIVGAAAHADLPFILAVQVMRILMILAAGPAVVGWIARHAGPNA